MRDKLRTLLGIEPGEESMVSMLLAQSVFIGIFIGAFDIVAHSLLLSTFNEKMLARGYIVTGITGIFVIMVYLRVLRRVKFTTITIINLFIAAILILFLWSVLIYSHSKWIIFIIFILFGPFNIIALLGYRGTASRFITNRQGKRILPVTDSAPIIGIFIVSLAIPVLISLNFKSGNLLLICVISLFISAIIQWVIGARFNPIETHTEQDFEKSGNRKSLFIGLREDSSFRNIVIFSALSVLTVFFIQYLFMAVARVQYPIAENLAAFLGIFSCCMMIFILYFKFMLFPYILNNYGFRTCLLISPILITIFTVLLIATGFFLGSTPGTSVGFFLLLILLAITRIISKSLKDTVEDSSFRVIYQSIDKAISSELGAGKPDVLNEISVFLAGVILTGLGLVSFKRFIHFTFILLIVAVIWMFVALRLLREYRKSIKKETEKAALDEPEVDNSNNLDTLKNKFYAYLNFRTDYFRLISGDFSVYNKATNNWYFEEIIDHAYSKRDLNLLPVLKKTANNLALDEGVRQHSVEVIEVLQNLSVSDNTDNDRTAESLKILSGARMPQTTEILRLLRDKSIDSKRLAIYMIGKFNIRDLLSEVCACLSVPGVGRDAYEVIKTFGPGVEDELVKLYMLTSGNTKLSKTIIELLGNTCSQETIGFLYSRLWSNSRQLKEISLKCLISCGITPSEEEKQRLNLLIYEVIGIITWNLSAKVSMERDNDNFLLQRINQEIDRWNNFLFNLLSITYNSGSMARIMKYIKNGNLESVTYGLQMAAALVSDSIKPSMIAFLDNVPDQDKLKNLFQFFPGEIATRKKLLEDIINRDYNLISLWTKASALRSIERIDSDEMAESVTALLFSPEELIKEESSSLIARANPGLYQSASDRLPDLIKIRLDNIINGTLEKEEFLFEKVQFLSKYFGSGIEDELLSVAAEMKYVRHFDSKTFAASENWIVWPLISDQDNNDVELIYNREMERFARKFESGNNLAFYFLSLSAVEEFHFQFPDKSYKILKYIDINEE